MTWMWSEGTGNIHAIIGPGPTHIAMSARQRTDGAWQSDVMVGERGEYAAPAYSLHRYAYHATQEEAKRAAEAALVAWLRGLGVLPPERLDGGGR